MADNRKGGFSAALLAELDVIPKEWISEAH